MLESSLIPMLPDLTILVARDGTLLDHVGGIKVPGLALVEEARGQRLDAHWPEAAAAAVKQLARQAIAQRKMVETRFTLGAACYEVRAEARSPDRVLCTLRLGSERRGSEDTLAGTGEMPRPQLDRRGFLQRYQDVLASATLQERAAAVAVIRLGSLADIGRLIDAGVAEEVLRTALLRIPADETQAGVAWFLGQINDTSLTVVVESDERPVIESLLAMICSSLREPVPVGDAAFHLTPYAGVAILGLDASSPKVLIDQASSAAAEAQRLDANEACFFTKSLRQRSLARLDIAGELRAAISDGSIGLRYATRHDLKTGRALVKVGYMQWRHPLRGDVPPAEFLAVAEATGLAVELSRAAMQSLKRDFVRTAASSRSLADSQVRISFGPLRHHLLHPTFVSEVSDLLADGLLPADRVEIRLAERSFVALKAETCHTLHHLGIQIVVDEVGRSLSSLDLSARVPIYGVQLDRAWVTSLNTDTVAQKVCRAGISAALALDLTPIATGVDDEVIRRTLIDLGCSQGSGDLYGAWRQTARSVRAR